MQKRWWQSRKVWGTVVAALIRLFAHKWGIDAETASSTALIVLGGVSVEGIIDAASAFGRNFKRDASDVPPKA